MMLLSIVARQSEGWREKKRRCETFVNTLSVQFICFYSLKAQETSIRQVPVSAALVYSSQEPLCSHIESWGDS